jgi:hypothetical protein
VHLARWARVPLDHMASGEGIVETRLEAAAKRDVESLLAQPWVGRAAAAVADDDRRNAIAGRWHRMTVEQERAAEAVEQERNLFVEGSVIRTVRLVEPFAELRGCDRAVPEIAVLLGSGGYDAEAAARAGGDPRPARAFHDRGVDLVFAPVAVDRRPRRPGDHRAGAAPDRAPHQAIDERILERRKHRLAARRHVDQPFGIVAP